MNNWLKKICISFRLQSLLLKQEMDQAEIYGDTRENKKNKWLPYPENDVLSNAFFMLDLRKLWKS